jgi:hypothetical protein
MLALRTDLWTIRMQLFAGGNALLLEPSLPELAGLRGRLVPFQELLVGMAESGINLVASAEVLKSPRLAPRLDSLEARVYEEMAAAVTSLFSFAGSRWNSSLPSHKCALSIWQAGRSAGAPDLDELMRLHVPDLAKGSGSAGAGAALGAGVTAATAPAAAATAALAQVETERKEEEAPGNDSPRSKASAGAKKKGGKKGKDAKKEEEEAREAADRAAAAVAQAEAAERQAVEPDPVPDMPRTVLFETDDDPAVVGHVKCSFVKGTDAADKLDTTLAKAEVTHVYLDSALLASGVYSEASVRLMQDNPRQTPLRHAILCVLRTLRPLSLTNPASASSG